MLIQSLRERSIIQLSFLLTEITTLDLLEPLMEDQFDPEDLQLLLGDEDMLHTPSSEILLDLQTAKLKSMLPRLPGGLPEVLTIDPTLNHITAL
jgi:hypothetical protein